VQEIAAAHPVAQDEQCQPGSGTKSHLVIDGVDFFFEHHQCGIGKPVCGNGIEDYTGGFPVGQRIAGCTQHEIGKLFSVFHRTDRAVSAISEQAVEVGFGAEHLAGMQHQGRVTDGASGDQPVIMHDFVGAGRVERCSKPGQVPACLDVLSGPGMLDGTEVRVEAIAELLDARLHLQGKFFRDVSV